MSRLRITWVKSAIGYNRDQRRTIRAMGFHRLQETVEQEDNPSVRGMIAKVRHLVRLEKEEAAQ